MTGREHYRKAEVLLAKGHEVIAVPAVAGLLVDAAQVHATLALVAATIEAGTTRNPQNIRDKWNEVL